MRLLTSLFFLTLTLLGLWTFWWEPNQLIVKDHEITLNKSLEKWRGLRIAIIADIHAGSPYINEDKIEEIVRKTNALKADLILLPGDFVIDGVLGGNHIPIEVIAKKLSPLKAPLGVFSVLGNHDHWENAGHIHNVLEKNNLPVIDQKVIKIDNEKYLIGLEDFIEGKGLFLRTISDLPKNKTAICMTHTPDMFPHLPPKCGLTIAGHTHGGQINIPFIGPLVVPSDYGTRYAEGVIEEDDKILFVATGIGTSIIPARFNVPPEISLLHLK